MVETSIWTTNPHPLPDPWPYHFDRAGRKFTGAHLSDYICGFVWMGRGAVFCISRAAVIKPEVCITCREKAKCRRQTWKTGTMWDCWPRSRTLASSSTRSSPRPRGLPGWVSPLSTEWGNPSKQPKSPFVTDHIARLLSIVVCLCF